MPYNRAEAIRRQHVAQLLRYICESNPVTRGELAGRADLTKVTVASLVGELINAGLVHDIGVSRHSRPGRPASRVVPHPLGPVGIGLEFEIDHVAGCVVDLSGQVCRRDLRRLDVRGMTPARAVRAARPVLRKLFEDTMSTGRVVAGVGVSIAALFGRDRDEELVVRSVPGLGWGATNLRSLVVHELEAIGAVGVDARIGGSVTFAARAECRGQDGLYVGGEAEVGAVPVTDGVPHRCTAGSVGHVAVRRRGRPCPCGQTGCLDRYAGRAAMAQAVGLPETALERATTGTEPAARLVHEGEPGAVKAARDGAVGLAHTLAAPLAALDPQSVILGGRLAALGEVVMGALGDRLAGQHTSPPLRVGTLGPDAAQRGAALSALAEIAMDPLGWS